MADASCCLNGAVDAWPDGIPKVEVSGRRSAPHRLYILLAIQSLTTTTEVGAIRGHEAASAYAFPSSYGIAMTSALAEDESHKAEYPCFEIAPSLVETPRKVSGVRV